MRVQNNSRRQIVSTSGNVNLYARVRAIDYGFVPFSSARIGRRGQLCVKECNFHSCIFALYNVTVITKLEIRQERNGCSAFHFTRSACISLCEMGHFFRLFQIQLVLQIWNIERFFFSLFSRNLTFTDKKNWVTLQFVFNLSQIDRMTNTRPLINFVNASRMQTYDTQIISSSQTERGISPQLRRPTDNRATVC